jgi:hypothetical protein
MRTCVISIDLERISARLSQWYRCHVSAADVRELFLAAGFEESPLGWLTDDLRPATIAFLPPGATLF